MRSGEKMVKQLTPDLAQLLFVPAKDINFDEIADSQIVRYYELLNFAGFPKGSQGRNEKFKLLQAQRAKEVRKPSSPKERAVKVEEARQRGRERKMKEDEPKEEAPADEAVATEAAAEAPSEEAVAAEEEPKPKPKRVRKSRAKVKVAEVEEAPVAAPEAVVATPVVEAAPAPVVEAPAPVAEPASAPAPEPVAEAAPEEPAKPKRRGWWSLGK